MVSVHYILMVLALACFAFAAVGIAAPRGNLTAAGLFLWVLATLVAK